MSYSLNSLYCQLGVTKQSVYQYEQRQYIYESKITELLGEAEDLRKEHPGCGMEKMYYSLNPDFIGRDKFIELVTDLGFRLNKKINYRRTTYSIVTRYANLIQGMIVTGPSKVWQTDITYYEVNGRFYYLVFIIDVYTKIIVGHQASDNMRAVSNVKALEMAFRNYTAPMIHHSDRGSQYTSKEYIKVLEKHNCQISMAQKAQDNAYAESINSTIKNEYLGYWKQNSFEELKKQVDKAVLHYNNKRLHNNLNREKPVVFNEKWQLNKGENKIKMTIYNNNI